jgi:hypothetical protein
MRDSELRLKLAIAKRNLVKLGYEHICSVMTSDPTNCEYGSKFSKLDGSPAIWVNIDTVDQIIADTDDDYICPLPTYYVNNSDSDSPAEF